MKFPWSKDRASEVIPPAVIGKHFFADLHRDGGGTKNFSIFRGSFVATGQKDALFTAWNREDAVRIVEFLDAIVEMERTA